MADIRTSSLGSPISFTVVTSTGGSKTAEFGTPFPAGVYTIYSIAGDNDLEIYLGAEDGSNVGYSTNGNKAIIASAPFKYVTTANANSFDAIVFELYQVSSEAATLNTKTDAFWAPPTITDVTPSSLYNQNSTTTVTGSNFASNVTAKFRKSDDLTLVDPKSIVRGSATSIILTRPDSFSPTDAPYDIVITNPTAGLSATSTNAISAGSAPSWTTSSALPSFQKTQAYSQSVVATDADLSPSITYSQVAATLPTGITFSNGTFSGTPVTNDGSYSAVIRATDLGGNFVDRTFTLAQTKPDAPTIGTATATGSNTATVSFTAPTYTGTSTIASYRIVSSPAGGSGTLSQAGSGTINVTGLTDATTYTFTVIATNASGDSLASAASNSVVTTNPVVSVQYLIIGGGGSGDKQGGGGAGGVLAGTTNLATGTPLTCRVGAGGAGGFNTSTKGTDSQVDTLIAYAGGVGGGTSALKAGGSGAGAHNGAPGNGLPGPGTPVSGQGHTGGVGPTYGANGGGGGAGTAGNSNQGGAGTSSTITGSTITFAGGGGGGQGDQNGGGGTGQSGGGNGGGWGYASWPGPSSATTFGSGGGGQGYAQDNGFVGGNGFSGYIVLKYPDNKTLSSSGMTVVTDPPSGGFKVSKITAGNGTVTIA